MDYNKILLDLKKDDSEWLILASLLYRGGDSRLRQIEVLLDIDVMLEPSHFNNLIAGRIYNGILEDPETFSVEKDVDEVTFDESLKHLISINMLTTVQLKAIAQDIVFRYKKRQILFKMSDIAEQLPEEKDLDKLLSSIETLYESKPEKELTLLEVLNEDYTEQGLLTGITDFDKIELNLSNGNLYSLGADTGMGKTTTALNIAYKNMLKDKKVLYFNLEQTQRDILFKVGAMFTNTTRDKLRYINKKDPTSIQKIHDKIKQTLTIIDRGDISANQILALAKIRNKKMNYSLIIVDYWQLLARNEKGESTLQKLIQTADTLLATAKQLNIPVLVLGQINKEEARNGILDRNSFHGSKQLSNNSSYVFMQYKVDNQTFVKVVKSRNPLHIEKEAQITISEAERIIN